jgi:hypothetical protein
MLHPFHVAHTDPLPNGFKKGEITALVEEVRSYVRVEEGRKEE